MKDEVVGLCVLVPLGDEEYQLYLTERRGADGQERRTHLPCQPEGAPKLKRYYPVWRFSRDGERLHVHPSLHDVGFFHNGYNWTVRFVEVAPTVDSLDATALHRELNLTPEGNGVRPGWQEERVAAYRADGTLLPRA